MRPTSDADAEHHVLTTEAGRDLLAEVGLARRATPTDIARWRRNHPAVRVSAALRLVEGRRRGLAKFARAGAMWFDPVGLEQATSEVVARHKARRFAGLVAFDLCAGIGGDTIAIAEAARGVVSVDLDPGMTRRARWNAEVHGVGHKVAPLVGRAEDVAVPADRPAHIDPDRRAHGPGRARLVDDYVPGLPFLRSLLAHPAGVAIKLGPASDFDSAFADVSCEVEIEVISLGGECKEATVWSGPLAEVRRRATRLPEGATWTDRDDPGRPPEVREATRPNAWVFDPDPALARAGLLDGFAAAHDLARITPQCDLLTGPSRVESPFLAPFEVDESLPLDLKRLRRMVADRRLGPLEIKTRGLDLTPESLRKSLRPDGPNPATLLLVGGRGPSLAIVARRG